MYDAPYLRTAWDAWWALVREALSRRGIEAGTHLRRDGDYHDSWLQQGLILGQTCGWPYASGLRSKVTPVARFDFDLEVERPGDYFSWFITLGDAGIQAAIPGDLEPFLYDRKTIVAINSPISQSGWRVLSQCVSDVSTISANRILFTGSHVESIRAVAAGRAHLAAIDAATWQFVVETEPACQRVKQVCRSTDAPGLPLIVGPGMEAHRDTVLESLREAFEHAAPNLLTTLCLRGIVEAKDADYDVLQRPPYGLLAITPNP